MEIFVKRDLVLCCFLILFSNGSFGNLQSDIGQRLSQANDTVLSRQRRYLVFPEGSSFQVVYDLAYPSVDGIGFFVYGNTAGLAWELPSTPVFLDKKYMKKEQPEPTTTMLPYLDHPHEDEHDDWPEPVWDTPDTGAGWKSKADKIPSYGWNNQPEVNNYHRHPVSSYKDPFKSFRVKKPASFSKGQQRQFVVKTPLNTYSNPNRKSYLSNRNIVYREPQIQRPLRSRFIDTEHYHNIHRRTRRELYGKFEEFFSVFTTNGRSCILKIICEVNKRPKEKGSFWDEFLKIVFRVKPEDFYGQEDHYDAAANSSHNCDEMYPDCKGNVLNKLIHFDFKQ